MNSSLSIEFDPEDCPPDCSKPCDKVCPADAISLKRVMVGGEHAQSDPICDKLEVSIGLVTFMLLFYLSMISCLVQGGVIMERCYGCGRCLSVCPYDRISEHCVLGSFICFYFSHQDGLHDLLN